MVTWSRWWSLVPRITAAVLAGAIAVGAVAACTESAQRSVPAPPPSTIGVGPTPVRNVHGLGAPETVSIWVEASEDVKWTMRIEQ
jgi:hypothetical protein